MQEIQLTDEEKWIECAEATRRALCGLEAWDYLASSNHSQSVKTIIACNCRRQRNPHILQNVVTWGEDGLRFPIYHIQDWKETLWRPPGGLVRFLCALQSSSCSSFMLCDAQLMSVSPPFAV